MWQLLFTNGMIALYMQDTGKVPAYRVVYKGEQRIFRGPNARWDAAAFIRELDWDTWASMMSHNIDWE